MKPVVLKIVAAIVVVCCLLGFMGWRAMQAKIGKATEAEIRAVTPAVLLRESRQDPAAQDRYKRLFVLIGKVDTKGYPGLLNPKKTPAGQLQTETQEFLTKEGTTLKQIGALLAEGPIQVTQRQPNQSFPELSKSRGMIKLISEAGLRLSDAKQYEAGTDQLLLALKLSNALMASDGVIIDYLVGVAMVAIVDHSIQTALLDPGFPSDQCQRLLKALAPFPEKDEMLKGAIVEDYQRFTMPMLADAKKVIEEMKSQPFPGPPDDTKKEETFGTFEPVETAKSIGKVYAEEVANCDRPLSKFVGAEEEVVSKEAKEVPEEPKEDAGGFEKFLYHFKMNNGRNTIGRSLAAAGVTDKNLITSSCRLRAYRQAVRIHLAAILYRRAHGGSLPATSAGFTAILGSWPLDPYNGLPMLYNRDKAVAYSVGQNLVDDHGDISAATFSESADIGVSLGH